MGLRFVQSHSRTQLAARALDSPPGLLLSLTPRVAALMTTCLGTSLLLTPHHCSYHPFHTASPSYHPFHTASPGLAATPKAEAGQLFCDGLQSQKPSQSLSPDAG